MTTSPSQALRELSSALSRIPSDEVLTAGKLNEIVTEAQQGCEQSEYEDYMGEDM